MPERKIRPKSDEPLGNPGDGGGDGPRTPDVERPNTKELLDRMRRVDPRQARRYRQRSGE
ncbi:ubiquitin-like protein UBact [Candidatus Acetothermia bacterium]|nr:ubiquitin-like protein UBact [Candidatus Acetothermia bacterium]MBI3643828.1 ubiquitin-like protein UBact [Candidatus Acetothermia bacterium]